MVLCDNFLPVRKGQAVEKTKTVHVAAQQDYTRTQSFNLKPAALAGD